MTLTLVIPSLGRGGAERVLTLLAGHWSRNGCRVSILTFERAGEAPAYAIDPAVRVQRLDVFASSQSRLTSALVNLRRALVLRRAIRHLDPDVVVSFMLTTNVLTLLACAGLRSRVVVSERLDPAIDNYPPPWRVLAAVLYRRAAAIVVQTQAAARFFHGALAEKCLVIPNPLDPAIARTSPARVDDSTTVVAMGRLDQQKGFDLLLHAFALAAPAMPGWVLEIWGDGPERERLASMIRNLGLDERALLRGVTARPAEVLAGAAVFALSSRFEGYPNVLCEAMAAGLPAAAFDCPSGPSEIVAHERNGLLVPAGDVAGLSKALERLAGSPSLRTHLADRAIDIRERLSLERIAGLWAMALDQQRTGATPVRGLEAV